MGKFIIKITPSYRNIVIAPVIPEETFIMYPDIQVKMNTENAIDDANPIVDFGFYQLNQKMRNKFTIVTTVNNNTITHTCTIAEAQEFKCIFQRVARCEIRLATYQIKMDIFNRLAMQYAQIPFMFDKNDVVNTALTADLMFVDSSYTFFKEDGKYYPRE